MKLKDKVALITGGSQGLGKSIALAMADQGAQIVICSVDPEKLASTAREIEGRGTQCLPVRCDVSSSAEVAAMYAQIAARFGTLHILVNNAALTPSRPVDEERRLRFNALQTTPIPRQSLGITKEMTDQEWLRFWGVNVHGVFYCTREALRLMEPQREGKIINIASVAGISGMSAHSPHYSATKGALVGFTRAVAAEVAGANIYVNAIACGAVLSPPMEEFIARRSPEELNALYQMIPIGRLGRPEDYAALAVYLASDECYLVGSIINATGGMVI